LAPEQRLKPRVPGPIGLPGPAYVELQVTTNYSFLRGASHVEEPLVAAQALGMPAIAVTDHNTLAGIARAHARAEEASIRLIVGCRLDLGDSLPVLAYPTDRAAYARLCRLLTLGKGRAGKRGCTLAWADLASHGDGLIAVLLPDVADAALTGALARLRRDFAGRCYLALGVRRRPGTRCGCASSPTWRKPRGCRPSSPATCCSMSWSGGSCTTWSPASARAAPSTTPGSAASASPTGT